jgi:hypothetical protein
MDCRQQERRITVIKCQTSNQGFAENSTWQDLYKLVGNTSKKLCYNLDRTFSKYVSSILYNALPLTFKDYALTVLHTSQITIGHTRFYQSVTAFASRCLVAATNGGRSPSSGFLNGSQPQLPVSQNSSQPLNCSSPLTKSLTHQQLNSTNPLH